MSYNSQYDDTYAYVLEAYSHQLLERDSLVPGCLCCTAACDPRHVTFTETYWGNLCYPSNSIVLKGDRLVTYTETNSALHLFTSHAFQSLQCCTCITECRWVGFPAFTEGKQDETYTWWPYVSTSVWASLPRPNLMSATTFTSPARLFLRNKPWTDPLSCCICFMPCPMNRVRKFIESTIDYLRRILYWTTTMCYYYSFYGITIFYKAATTWARLKLTVGRSSKRHCSH